MKNKIVNAFILSPLFVLLVFIFNIADTKSILSRLIPFVCVYCLIYFRGSIRDNLKNSDFRRFSILSGLVIVYFSIMHLVRGDEFTIARTLIAATAYTLFVPWGRVDRKWVYMIVALGGVAAGINGYYEHHIQGIERVGRASNPIPYAFYCASLLICCLYLLIYNYEKCKKLMLLAMLGGVGAGYSLVLTEVRGIWIAIPLIVSIVLSRKILSKISLKIAIVTTLVLGLVFFVSKPVLEERWDTTVAEYNEIANGNYNTSIGIRLTLWNNGLDFIMSSPVFGIGDELLEKRIHQIDAPWAGEFPHLHNQFIDFAARSGGLGLLLILAWVTSIALEKKQSSINLNENLFLLGFVVLFYIGSLTDVHLIHAHIVYLISMLSGVVILLDKKIE